MLEVRPAVCVAKYDKAEGLFPMSWQAHQVHAGVLSECTALLGWKLGFRGVSDSGFSSCTAPTYYCVLVFL